MTELEETERTAASERAAEPEKVENVTIGSEKYRGFILDCVLHSEQEGDIDYNYIFRILMTEQKNMHYM